MKSHLFILTLLATGGSLCAQTIFTGNGDGTTWGDTGNWSLGTPVTNLDAFIDTGGAFNVEILSNAFARNLFIGSDDSLLLRSGLNLDLNTSGSLTNAGTLTTENNTDLVFVNNVLNSGQITINSGANATDIELRANSILSGGGIITLVGGNARINDLSGTQLLTISDQTIEGEGQIGVNTINIDNQANGLIDANVSLGTLTLDPAATFANAGVVRATNGGILALNAGSFVQAGAGVIRADGDDGIGNKSTLLLNSGSSITGGVLEAVNGGIMQTAASSTVSLDTVTLNGELGISNNTFLQVSNTITNTGNIQFSSAGSNMQLRLTDDTVLTGGGTVTMDTTSGTSTITDSGGTKRLTLTDQTIQGTGNIGNNSIAISVGAGGVIDANVSGGTLLVDTTTITPDDAGPPSLTNDGLMQATSGGILALGDGDFTNNTIIQADGGGSLVELRSGAAIEGGVLQGINGGTMQTAVGSVVDLDGVTLNGELTISNNSFLEVSNTITNTGNIQFSPAGAGMQMRLEEDTVFTGGGTMTMDTTSGSALITDISGTKRLTLVDQTIQGTGNIGNNSIAISVGADGVIDANVSGGTLLVDPSVLTPDDAGPSSLTNNGLMQATSGGILALGAGDYQNNTIIQADGPGSILELRSGVEIDGGVLQGINGGTMQTAVSSVVDLIGVTLNGDLTLSTNSFLDVSNTITNTGNIQFSPAGGGMQMRLEEDTVFTGGGTVTMDTTSGSALITDISGTKRLTLMDQTIEGTGNIGSNTIALTVGANGTIDANATTGTGTLIVDASNLTPDDLGSRGLVSDGMLRASNGGELILAAADITNNGTLEALDGSTVTSNGTLTNLSGGTLDGGTYRSVENGNGSTVAINGTSLETIATGTTVEVSGAGSVMQFGGTAIEDSLITNAGTLRVHDGRDFTMTNALTNAGAVSLGGSGLTGASLTSGGDITNTSTGEISGHGTINNTILNSGTVRSSGGTLAIVGGVIDGQSGTMEINSGSTLDLSGASGASDADFLNHNGNLALGANNVTINEDYTNANFGVGNSFDARANVSGSGQILASGDVDQQTTGDVAGGVIAFGNVHVGDSNTLNYQIANAGTTGPTLRGALQTSVNGGNITDGRLSGTGVTAANFGPIATGADTGNLAVTFTASSAGALSGQVVHIENNFDNVAGDDISITGAAYRLANPTAASPDPVDFGNFHVGDPAPSQALSITNNTPADGFSEGLDAGFAGTTGGVTTNGGSFDNLAAGSTDNSSLSVGIDTSTAGSKSGTATISLASDGSGTSGLGTSSLGSQSVDVTGAVYRLANVGLVSVPVDFGIVRVGESASQNLTVSNTAPADGFSEALNVSVASTTGDAGAAGSISLLAAGASDNSSLSINMDTATVGNKSGTVNLGLQSDGSGSSGLGITALAGEAVNVQGQVNFFADAEFSLLSGSATLTKISETEFTLDFGDVDQNTGIYTVSLGVLNLLQDPTFQDELDGVFETTLVDDFDVAGFTAFSGVSPGDTFADPEISFNSIMALGPYSDIISLIPTSSNLSSSDQLAEITLNVQGQVIPEPSTYALVFAAVLLGVITRRQLRRKMA